MRERRGAIAVGGAAVRTAGSKNSAIVRIVPVIKLSVDDKERLATNHRKLRQHGRWLIPSEVKWPKESKVTEGRSARAIYRSNNTFAITATVFASLRLWARGK